MSRGWKNLEAHAFNKSSYYEETIATNVDFKGYSTEVSDGNEEQVFGNKRKTIILMTVAKNLAELYTNVLCKIKLERHKTGYSAKDICKRNTEDAV